MSHSHDEFASLTQMRVSIADDGVATVTLASAHSNSLSLPAFDELHRTFSTLGAMADVRCVLLHGEGRHFCSGIDLGSFTTLMSGDPTACPARRNTQLYRNIQKLQAAVSSLEDCRVPVVAAIHGACLGGAIDLVLSADIRLATRESSWGVIEAELGFAADLGTLARLPRVVGEGRARELALTCRRFSGAEALQYGLVTSTFDDLTALMTEARALAARLAASSPLAMTATKAELLHGRDRRVGDALDHIAWRNAATLASDDLTKALAARSSGRRTGCVTFAKL
jgi:enoyl-CoA hydratase/carnithine racemase